MELKMQSISLNKLPVKKSFKNALYKLPWPVTKFFLYNIYMPVDMVNHFTRNNSPFRPPYSLMKFGGYSEGETAKIFTDFAEYLVDNRLINKDSTVLDMGCGVGSLARLILDILKGDGQYIGMDIIKESIQWCQTHLSDRYPNARFQHTDIYNKSYNPKGPHLASEYKFPFEDNTHDLVILKSVFTHMVPIDVDNYLSEIGRILKPKGICVATFFVLNEDSRACIESGKTRFDFKYSFEECLVTNPVIPEDAIAYDQDQLQSMYSRQSMRIDRIDTGNWCHRQSHTQNITSQDILISQKICVD
jgi:ubiquinone/menaquinone biosynthesis C-methylase UbiE